MISFIHSHIPQAPDNRAKCWEHMVSLHSRVCVHWGKGTDNKQANE